MKFKHFFSAFCCCRNFFDKKRKWPQKEKSNNSAGTVNSRTETFCDCERGPKWCISSPQPFLDCAWKREKSWKHNEVEETNGKKFNRSRFGLFHQHGIHLIHAFVLCKFEPLPCWTSSRLHREELIGDQASLVAYMLLRCWCGHQEASSAENKPESVHSNPKNHDKVFNLKANKTASTIKVKQIKLQ